jgi:hypothetical protein
MDVPSPERPAPLLEAHQMNLETLCQQRERYRLRCLVNSDFLSRGSDALHACYNEASVPSLRDEGKAILRLFKPRERDDEQFPLWHIVGNHIAFIAKTRRISGHREVHKLCDRYIRGDDLHGELKTDTFHEAAVDHEINLNVQFGPNRPFSPRHDRRRELEFHGSGLMQLERLTVAKEADLFRAVAFSQSAFLLRVRDCILGKDIDPSAVVKCAMEMRAELSHISILLPPEEKSRLVSVPVMMGCAYFDLDRAKGQSYPPFNAFLALANPRAPMEYLGGLSPDQKARVLNDVKVYFDRGGVDHPRMRNEIIFGTEKK